MAIDSNQSPEDPNSSPTTIPPGDAVEPKEPVNEPAQPTHPTQNSTTQNSKLGLTETISMRCQPIVKRRFKKLCTFRIQAGSSVNDGDVLSQLMDFAKENSGIFTTFSGIKQAYKID